VAGVWASSAVAADHGSGDPQFVVIDEAFGAAVTLVLLPAEPLWWLAGFLAFRLFDVVKPWPASFAHRHVSGGLGIMLDDAIAAVYAAGLLLAAQALIAAWG
jgi:phosphatidylglycerophosphatase A